MPDLELPRRVAVGENWAEHSRLTGAHLPPEAAGGSVHAISKRSVLLVVSSLGAGGAERVVSTLASLWVEKGWEVTVLTFSSTAQDHYTLPPSVRRVALGMLGTSVGLSRKLYGNLKRISAVRAAVRECRPEAVVSFIDQTNVIVLVALLASGVPVIVSERIDPHAYKPPTRWRLARYVLYRTAAAVVVQTTAAAAWANSVVPSHKVRTIPNFVRPLRKPNNGARERFVLAVGRLDRQKGFDVLLEAFALSGIADLDYRLVILGEGLERARLIDQARRLGVLEAVDMPGAHASPEDWMERASVFVLSSRYEGFPNVLLEAMAMGCAVVATECPSGPSEIIRPGEDGLMVAPEDASALAAALKRLLTDEKLRHRLGESAVTVRERFAVVHILKLWELAIDGAVSV